MPLCHTGRTERLLPTRSPVTPGAVLPKAPQLCAASQAGPCSSRGSASAEKLPGRPAPAPAPRPCSAPGVEEEGRQRPGAPGAAENIRGKKCDLRRPPERVGRNAAEGAGGWRGQEVVPPGPPLLPAPRSRGRIPASRSPCVCPAPLDHLVTAGFLLKGFSFLF